MTSDANRYLYRKEERKDAVANAYKFDRDEANVFPPLKLLVLSHCESRRSRAFSIVYTPCGRIVAGQFAMRVRLRVSKQEIGETHSAASPYKSHINCSVRVISLLEVTYAVFFPCFRTFPVNV